MKNIRDDALPSLPFLSWKALAEAKFAFAESFAIKLSHDDVLYADQVIRLLPKKRMTVFGVWRGKNVVAKLFFDKKHAKRHLQKEMQGIELLLENKIPTPQIYHHDISQDKKIHILISERIFIGKSLDEIWRERKSVTEIMPILQAMMIELATQHVLGIVQQDLHLKNFLILPKKIYTLDGAEIENTGALLPKKESMLNLALFFSQFGVGMKPYYEKLFKYYAKSRGWILKLADFNDLTDMINEHDRERWQQYSKKIYRDCTDFMATKSFNTIAVINRRHMQPAFETFLSDPESLMQQANQILKAGRSSTVIKTTINGRDYVIKRYNVKNMWHFLRRMFRPTRAYATWRMAHKLILFGVPTAKPIAFLEKRMFGLRTVSYSISEYVKGPDAQHFFSTHATDDIDTVRLIKKVTALLKSFANLKITHGDLKLTNILIDEKGIPMLIDLDGTVEHNSDFALRRIFKKEIKRFLRNFGDKPYLQAEFNKELR